MEVFSVEYALLAMQRALLGEVTAELRAVVIDFDTEQLIFFARFYYDKEACEKMIDLWQCAATEASASLGPDCFTHLQIERVDYPEKIPSCGYYAYLRKEPNLPEKLDNKVKIAEMTIGYALLAVQNALLGVVTPQLRAVIVDFEEEIPLLFIRFYYDTQVPQETINLWSNAMSKSSADFFGSICCLDCRIERLDYPKDIDSVFRGRYAYRRKEEKISYTIGKK
jgi:hypothetical protein